MIMLLSLLNSVIDTYYPDRPETLIAVVKEETAKMKDGPLQRLEKHVQELHDLCESKGLDL